MKNVKWIADSHNMTIMTTAETPETAGYAALLIDVIGSRAQSSRTAFQDRLLSCADATNRRVESIDPIAITIGDELQGTYARIEAALLAAVHFRLGLIEATADARAAIGWGSIEVRDPDRTPFAQDGTAWWRARETLESIADVSARGNYQPRLAVWSPAEPERADCTAPAVDDATGLPAPVTSPDPSSHLWRTVTAMFDHAIAALDDRDAAIVLADFAGLSGEELATLTGISPSAASSRRSRNRLREIVIAMRALEDAA